MIVCVIYILFRIMTVLLIIYMQSWGFRFLAVLPDGRVVSGSGDRYLCVWNINTRKCEQILKTEANGKFHCVTVLPDGRVVSGSGNNRYGADVDCTLRVWNVTNGECERVLSGHTEVYI